MEDGGDYQRQIIMKKPVGQSDQNKIIYERKECEALNNTPPPHNLIINDLPPLKRKHFHEKTNDHPSTTSQHHHTQTYPPFGHYINH